MDIDRELMMPTSNAHFVDATMAAGSLVLLT